MLFTVALANYISSCAYRVQEIDRPRETVTVINAQEYVGAYHLAKKHSEISAESQLEQ